MSAPTRINGTSLVISVGGTAVAHTTSATLNVEVATIDVSSKDDGGDQTLIAGQKSGSIDFEGLTDFSATQGVDDLLTLINARAEIAWSLGDGSNTFSGNGIFTSLSLDAPMEDASTFSGSIAISSTPNSQAVQYTS